VCVELSFSISPLDPLSNRLFLFSLGFLQLVPYGRIDLETLRLVAFVVVPVEPSRTSFR